jgi:hypothetical protein
MDCVFSSDIPELLKAHFDHLHSGSGICTEVMRERGYSSILGEKRLVELGFSAVQRRIPGIIMPSWGVNGSVVGHVYRPDRPRLDGRDKPVKYENVPRSSLHLDIPPRCLTLLGDPATSLFITEGIKKGDALASQGVCTVVLPGVWGFKGKNAFGGVTLLAEWDYVALKDRDVFVVFDSDVSTKPQVRQAMERLAQHLLMKGAKPYVILLPEEA